MLYFFFWGGGDGVIKISLEGRGIKTGQKRIAKFLTLPYQCASLPPTCIIQHLSVLYLHRFCFCTENRKTLNKFKKRLKSKVFSLVKTFVFILSLTLSGLKVCSGWLLKYC